MKFTMPGIWNLSLFFEHSEKVVYFPGDLFYISAVVRNNDPVCRHIQAYILLEAFDQLFFWPSWIDDPSSQLLELQPGTQARLNILNFIWPSDAGSASGLYFWGALVDPASGLLAGQYDFYEFAYQE